MPRKKEKPATRGERVQMRLCDCRLVDVRDNEHWKWEAAVIERAMVRVEKAERLRCAMLVADASRGLITLDTMLDRIEGGGV